MIKDKTFRITYYSNKAQQEITRFGKWIDKCRYGQTLKGVPFITYYDIDQQGFRTATQSWKVRY